MRSWRSLTPADVERLFDAQPDILAAVVAWIDEHPELDPITTEDA